MHAVIGQFSGLYSPVWTGKIKEFIIAKLLRDLYHQFSQVIQQRKVLNFFFTLNCVLKRVNHLLKTVSK